MNCVTVLCIIQMYYSIELNPAASLVASADVYSHLPSFRRCGSLPLNCRATWSWNPLRIRNMRGATTHVFMTKISTDWTTALNKNSDTRGAASYLLIILVNLSHTACDFVRFLTTTGQSLSVADITRHKYLKEVAISRGRTYTP